MTGNPIAAAVQERVAVEVAAAVAAERVRVQGLLTVPLLHALRSIPDRPIHDGCVITDGSEVRERLRAAWLAVCDGSPATRGSSLAEVPAHRITHALPPTLARGGREHVQSPSQSEPSNSPEANHDPR